jgi:hypothetical protein
MALTPTEEAQTRQLIAQEAPLLSLASNEPTITSKLGATKVNLSSLPAASSASDSDLFLVRQGTTDKSIAGSLIKGYTSPAASETSAGIVRLATDAETASGTARNIAVDPAGVAYVNSAVQGLFKNLVISTTGTTSIVAVSCDELIVESLSNIYKTLRSVSVTPSLSSAGANGLDAGTSASNTWYSVWVIWNGTTISGLLSLSATSPTMPSGYTHKSRVGWVRSDSTANKFPLSFKQIGRNAQYVVSSSSNLTGLPFAAAGIQGSISTPTYISTSIVNYVPTATASKISFLAVNSNSGTMIIAPNGNFGSYNNSTNPPPIVNGVSSTGTPNNTKSDLILESSNLFIAFQDAGQRLAILGWEDNI